MGEERIVEINTYINSKIYAMMKGERSYRGDKAWTGLG